MHRFISNHTYIIHFYEKKKIIKQKNIKTCVSKIRFYVVFGSKKKKKVTYMPTYSCIYHISIFMHISYYVNIFMLISNYVSIFMHA